MADRYFRKNLAVRFLKIKNRTPFLFQSQAFSCSFFCQIQSKQQKQKRYSSLGIAFDIDGVILRGRVPIGGSPQALRKLYGDYGSLKVPFLFLTNGSGIPESRRAIELSEFLGVKILRSQIRESTHYCHWKRGTCSGNVRVWFQVRKVLSLDEYASLFENIDPVSQYKKWTTNQELDSDRSSSANMTPRYNVSSETVKAVFVFSDPADWGRGIQVLCDVLRSGGLPGKDNGHQPPLYFAADDLEYQVVDTVEEAVDYILQRECIS